MNYYLVLCKCGHVTRDYYMPINFCIMAEDGEEAARIARKIPRVKHDYKDAILKVTKVNKEVFDYQNEINNLDPYLLCHSKHEQNEIFDLIKMALLLGSPPPSLTQTLISRPILVKILAFAPSVASFFLLMLFHFE